MNFHINRALDTITRRRVMYYEMRRMAKTPAKSRILQAENTIKKLCNSQKNVKKSLTADELPLIIVYTNRP